MPALNWPPAPGVPALAAGARVHLIGVGGAGMSGLARALAAAGLSVSGSDRQDSAALRALAGEGVTVHVGHRPENLPAGCDLVVHSPAVRPDNPELAAARARGVPITKRAVLVGALLDARVGVAIAGTHGKTTTSGLVAHVLACAGLDPSFFVGGDVVDLGANARIGAGPHLVLEADEYDRSFLHGHPAVAIITNVEHDHPDHFPTIDDVVEAFASFASGVRAGGRLIVNAASPLAWRVGSAAGAQLEGYYVEGDAVPATGTALSWVATDLREVAGDDPADARAAGERAAVEGAAGDPSPGRQMFDVRRGAECLGTWTIRLAGRHNAGNAVAAIAAAEALGVDREATRRALATYRGAARRFEVIGRASGVTVVDDYAHHPTEVAATIAAARGRYPGRRVHAVLEPHTYSRVALLADDFAASLGGADGVVVTPIYAAREAPPPGVDAARIARGVPGALVADDLDHAAALAAGMAAPGDVLLFLGAGDIPRASRRCLAALRRQDADRLAQAASAEGLGGDVMRSTPLAEHTSLRVGGAADILVRVRAAGDLAGWWRLARAMDIPVRVLGRGTNVLVGDGGVPGLVLLNRCEGWSVEADDVAAADSDRAPGPALVRTALVRAESGVTLAALGQSLAREGWAGIEAGVGIPGSVGAGVVTNAGAHGWEMADSLVAADVLEPDGEVRVWSREDLRPRYRGSTLKGDANRVVLAATLRVRRDEPTAILARIARHAAQRRATQPNTPSVGSMFKNPAGDFAGRLIEAAGLKGTIAGGAEISPVHANFFVNRGGARAADVARLVEIARSTVRRRFGIALELEIERLGVDDVD